MKKIVIDIEKYSNYVREEIAMKEHDPKTLTILAEDELSTIRQAVAMDTNTPGKVLAKLSKDEAHKVVVAVAGNINTPSEILATLSHVIDDSIQRNVAANTNTPKEILNELANNACWKIRLNCARNTNTPINTLVGRLLYASRINEISEQALDTLMKLAKDENVDVNVHLEIAKLIMVPGEIIEYLAKNHKEEIVRQTANNNLIRRNNPISYRTT